MDYEKTKDYTLSIRLMPDGFSFSTLDVRQDESFHYQTCSLGNGVNYFAALQEAILQHEELFEPYQRVNIIVSSADFSLVPCALFVESEKEKYFSLTNRFRNPHILFDNLDRNGAVNLYALDQDIYEFLCRTFANPHFYHHQSILTEYFVGKSKMGNSAKMICQVRDRMLDVLCFRNGRLQLANTFRYQSANDVMYFIMLSWQGMHLDECNDELQLIGEKDVLQELNTLINPYIAKITPVVFPAQIYNLGNESMHAPFDLIVLPLCV